VLLIIPCSRLRCCLTESAQRLGVAASPRGALGGAELGGLHGALVAEATMLAASAGEAAQLTMLVASLADPVDARIVTDALVEGIDHNDLEPLVHGVLGAPVGVQHTQVAKTTADALLGEGLDVADALALVDTLILGLTVDLTLRGLGLAAATLDADAEDGETRLGLESQSAGLVRARAVLAADNGGHLTILPAANTEQEAHGVALLLAPHLG